VRSWAEREFRRRWRFYPTAAGHEPVADFIRGLGRDDRAAILSELKDQKKEQTR
jgi:hypothetical protein